MNRSENIMKPIFVFKLVSEASADEDSTAKAPTTNVKYDRLWQQDMPQQICGYDISPSLSTSSNEDSTSLNTLQFAMVQPSPLNEFLPLNRRTSNATLSLNRRICNDLRLSANKSFSQNVRPVRPLPPRRVDGTIYDSRNSFDNRLHINRLSEKRQSDPQIRYAFYNKGFEVATSTKHRKYSLSHYEVRRKAMPNIDEYESMENDEHEESSDEWLGSQQNLQYYSGSSGRDITLLPKLKIRICDEMGARIQHSFDESSFSDELSANNSPHSTFDSNDQASFCKHKSKSIPDADTTRRIESDKENDAPVCKKCGHRIALQRQFTNTFT